ncbi:enoyl-CoA hydratase [Streptomyces sp. NPDC050560]|uniref:enoyl-CoA hydratase n=1 Tax=Streptomyces sp. NPDC050560 TaxID=3365630 RepID=UPI00379B84AA
MSGTGGSPAPVRTELRGEVAWVLIDRPHVANALDMDSLTRLAVEFERLRGRRDVRAVVLTGAGGGERPAFAAGGDIGEFAALTTQEAILGYQELYRRVGAAIDETEQPTLAAIAGPCVGGGAVLAATCDLRIAAPSARFGVPVARTLGNCLNTDDYVRLVTVLGQARVRELIMTARLLPADEMLGWGVVSQLAESDEALHGAAARLAERLASMAPLTVAATKENLRRIRRASTPDADDRDVLLRCFGSADFRNAVAAFAAGEKPVWQGR